MGKPFPLKGEHGFFVKVLVYFEKHGGITAAHANLGSGRR